MIAECRDGAREVSCREMYDQQARIAIRPRWVRVYDFSTGRIPQPLQDLAAKAGS